MNGRANATAQETRKSPHANNAKPIGRRYRPRAAGLLYLVTTVVLVLGAINGQNNLLFFIFGLAVAGLGLSGVLSGPPLMGLHLRRELPADAAVGEPMIIRYRLTSTNRWISAFGLSITDRRERKDSPRVGAFCPHLPTKQTRTVQAVIMPRHRGRADVDRVEISTSFPFGLARKSVLYTQPDHLWVRPWVAREVPVVFRRAGGADNVGELLRRPRGGDEFYALREYVPGDSPRSVAWRPSARQGRLIVREWSERLSRRAWVMLDLSSTADAERVISIGAALVRQALDAGLEVGCAVRHGPVLASPRGGRPHFFRLLDTLARLELPINAPAADALHAGERDAVVIVGAGAMVGGAPASMIDVRSLPDPFAAFDEERRS